MAAFANMCEHMLQKSYQLLAYARVCWYMLAHSLNNACVWGSSIFLLWGQVSVSPAPRSVARDCRIPDCRIQDCRIPDCRIFSGECFTSSKGRGETVGSLQNPLFMVFMPRCNAITSAEYQIAMHLDILIFEFIFDKSHRDIMIQPVS